MVFPKFEGQGLGKKLVENSVEFARKNGWTIKAHCSYAHSVLIRKTDVKDVSSLKINYYLFNNIKLEARNCELKFL